jgi:hypothetical protein
VSATSAGRTKAGPDALLGVTINWAGVAWARCTKQTDRKVGWGVYGSTWAYREGAGAERSGGGLGKFTIAGRVVDERGNCVAGVELQVGKTMVYTGANGEFELKVRKRKAYPVAVEGWKVVSGAEIAAGESVRIVVDH